jgi:Fic family protein
MQQPLLYLSLYFKTRRARYYEHLQRVRTHGEWEEWLEFFLDGVNATSREAAQTAKNVLNLFSSDRRKINDLGRSASSALRVHEYMQRKPVASIASVAKELKLSVPTVTASLNHLARLKVVEEVTGKRRHRLFAYTRYFNMVSEGTEPLS